MCSVRDSRGSSGVVTVSEGVSVAPPPRAAPGKMALVPRQILPPSARHLRFRLLLHHIITIIKTILYCYALHFLKQVLHYFYFYNI